MRSVYLLLILVIAIHVSDNLAAEMCPAENCIEASHCEEPVHGGVRCANEQPCCSVVKPEFRTACRHHGGECMDHCTETLRRSVSDCGNDQVCCVLV